VAEAARGVNPNGMSILEAVQFYLDHGMRPIPMHGVTEGRCNCGGIDTQTRKPCNAGKHAIAVSEPWKDGRNYFPGDFGPRDNIAIALGPWNRSSWLVCLDFDGPSDPGALFPFLPPTLTQKSPRGRHLFFTVQAFAPFGNWVDCLDSKYTLGTGVDVRYARGKINVAPSRSAFGAYEWQGWTEPVPLPESVSARIFAERRKHGLPIESRWDRNGKRP